MASGGVKYQVTVDDLRALLRLVKDNANRYENPIEYIAIGGRIQHDIDVRSRKVRS